MEPRISLVTPGVADLARARAFLWGRDQLAQDSGVDHDLDGHPWKVAHNPHRTLRDDSSVEV
jgi:hypothetical protein